MLMAIVSLIAWRGLDSVSRADSHLQASTEQTEALLRTLNQLDRDLALRASIELRTPSPNPLQLIARNPAINGPAGWSWSLPGTGFVRRNRLPLP